MAQMKMDKCDVGVNFMIDYLIHVYGINTEPFQSLSALSSEEALKVMKDRYDEGEFFWKRFKNSTNYLEHRKQTEKWLRESFIRKGEYPKNLIPIVPAVYPLVYLKT